jgi:hypothetical protein
MARNRVPDWVVEKAGKALEGRNSFYKHGGEGDYSDYTERRKALGTGGWDRKNEIPEDFPPVLRGRAYELRNSVNKHRGHGDINSFAEEAMSDAPRDEGIYYTDGEIRAKDQKQWFDRWYAEGKRRGYSDRQLTQLLRGR